jgi:hypothetical protein
MKKKTMTKKTIGKTIGVVNLGTKTASLYLGEKGGLPRWEKYVLLNYNDIPETHPDFGLFSYDIEGQTCKWVDLNKG